MPHAFPLRVLHGFQSLTHGIRLPDRLLLKVSAINQHLFDLFLFKLPFLRAFFELYT
ncbi:hypothetical protein SynPROSU1_00949 [Synechococcus sp. PROS-U-1]|nr:hypothetical protein SynPROSU1_00949 [Synechococcus sp. PROS-U-1]